MGTRTSRRSTLSRASSPWPTLVQTPTVPSSSSPPSPPHGWTDVTLSSARSPRVWILSRRSRPPQPTLATSQRHQLLLLHPASCKRDHESFVAALHLERPVSLASFIVEGANKVLCTPMMSCICSLMTRQHEIASGF